MAAENHNTIQSPKPITRSESVNLYPTTFVQADTSSFKQVVQMLTGSSPETHVPSVIKSSIPKNKLYERRNSIKNNFKINPLINPSHRKQHQPEILSPSILDFPSLLLSPVTPLIHDPFDRSGSVQFSPSGCYLDRLAEEKAIRDKGFYLHPSPKRTSPEPPRLLPLFPVTSPTSSGSTTTATTTRND